MLNQNYIQVFINAAGNVTIATIQPEEDNALEVGDIEYMTLAPRDLKSVIDALIAIDQELGSE